MRIIWLIMLITTLTGCGFHLQGQMQLAPPLNNIFIKTPDPYGYLTQQLQNYLKLSHVCIAEMPSLATTHLVILHDIADQQLLSVNGTAQTRQYNLRVTVIFEITDPAGHVILPPQTLIENRVITIQSNQILGSSNEVNLFYQQMRRNLAYAIMNRLASHQVSCIVINACNGTTPPH